MPRPAWQWSRPPSPPSCDTTARVEKKGTTPPPTCPDGHAGARLLGGHGSAGGRDKQRYQYRCHSCSNFFTQFVPKSLSQNQPNGANWFSSKKNSKILEEEEKARLDTSQSNACQPTLNRNPFQRSHKLYASKVTMGFHNKRGGISNEACRLRQTDAMMSNGQMWGACELNQTPDVEDK